MHFVTRWTAIIFLMFCLRIPAMPAQEPPPHPGAIVRESTPDLPTSQTRIHTEVEPVEANSGQTGADAPASGQDGQGAQQLSLPSSAAISGTVLNVNGEVVPGATVVLEGRIREDRRTVVTNDNGAFQVEGLKPGIPYRITIAAQGLEDWTSQLDGLAPGQVLFLSDVRLKVPVLVASVTVYATQEQIATEQVQVAEKQRVFGIFPNFYVTYDEHPVPLTTRLKYKLALKADTDPVTFFGVAFMAAIYQAGDIPDYGQGWDAYAKRVAAGYADTSTDIFIGGAILPALLKQDPRYFYQGRGTKKSRALHAIASPFVCKGDNGKTQPNYSSLGGDLASGGISNLYYPESNRGVGLVFGGFMVTTGVRIVDAVVQEFVLRRLTPSARAKQ